MRTEYEVYSPAFDAFMDPIKCGENQKGAEAIKEKLRDISGRKFGASCDWQVREIHDRMGPLPPKADVVTPLLVDEVRKLMAKHGQDCIVTVSWSATGETVNVVTAGSNRAHSEHAHSVGQKIAAAIGCGVEELTHEDRRDEHVG